jgi:[ribosomal protein S18]-alanine N-acetyltransferase
VNAVPQKRDRKIQIETMTDEHLAQVLVIEKEVFSDPWSRSSFENEVAGNETSFVRVALSSHERRVVGYFVAWIVDDEMHLGNLAVARSEQGKGIGQKLLDHLLASGRKRRARVVTLEVRESNIVAQKLYLRNGFRPIAIRRRYYPDNREDAIVMMLNL